MEKKKLVVVDFDGTLYRGSSLRDFIFFGLANILRNGDIKSGMKIICQIVTRVLRLTSHCKFKYEIVKRLEKKLPENQIYSFAQKHSRKFNISVIEIIDSHRSAGDVILLLSASPYSYMKHFASLLNITHLGATHTTPTKEKYIEMKGNVKRDFAEEFAAKNGLRFSAVVTDHHDDLPLIFQGKNIDITLINPTEKLKSILKSHKIDFKTC